MLTYLVELNLRLDFATDSNLSSPSDLYTVQTTINGPRKGMPTAINANILTVYTKIQARLSTKRKSAN